MAWIGGRRLCIDSVSGVDRISTESLTCGELVSYGAKREDDEAGKLGTLLMTKGLNAGALAHSSQKTA